MFSGLDNKNAKCLECRSKAVDQEPNARIRLHRTFTFQDDHSVRFYIIHLGHVLAGRLATLNVSPTIIHIYV